jgi:hypothetical protein
MDLLKEIGGFAEATVTRLIGQAQTIDPRILGLVFIFLVVFAAASRRILIFFGASLLAIVAFLIPLVPSSAPILIAIGAGFGSLLITIAGMRFRQRQFILRQEPGYFDRNGQKIGIGGRTPADTVNQRTIAPSSS